MKNQLNINKFIIFKMDIIDKIKNYLIECRADKDFINDSDSKLIKIFFKQNNLNVPDNIQKLICMDHLFFEKVINNIEIYKWLKESNYYDKLSGKIRYSPIIDLPIIDKPIIDKPIIDKQVEWEEIDISLTKKNNFKFKKSINYFEKWLFGT